MHPAFSFRDTYLNAFLIESDHIFVSSDQSGDLVGLMAFKAEEWLFSALHAGDMLNTKSYCLMSPGLINFPKEF